MELGVELGGIGDDDGLCAISQGKLVPTAKCQRAIYQCGDCQDNDGDGLVDGNDPDCLGVCDNTEDSYYGNIPGQNNTPCVQDCYFDQDTGPGNDGCRWSHECDPLGAVAPFPPSGDERCAYNAAARILPENLGCDDLMDEQTPACRDRCLPLTPNGCDCFGCCQLPGANRFVWLGSTVGGFGSCSRDTLSDTEACRPCTPVLSCFNSCTDCELCVGKEPPDTGCTPSPAGEAGQCPVGRKACGLKGQGPCPSGQYCITGCCVAVPA